MGATVTNFCEVCTDKALDDVNVYELFVAWPLVNGRTDLSQGRVLCTGHAAELDETKWAFKVVASA